MWVLGWVLGTHISRSEITKPAETILPNFAPIPIYKGRDVEEEKSKKAVVAKEEEEEEWMGGVWNSHLIPEGEKERRREQ